MRLSEAPLECLERMKVGKFEEVEIAESERKKFWLRGCPKCEKEYPVAEPGIPRLKRITVNRRANDLLFATLVICLSVLF